MWHRQKPSEIVCSALTSSNGCSISFQVDQDLSKLAFIPCQLRPPVRALPLLSSVHGRSLAPGVLHLLQLTSAFAFTFFCATLLLFTCFCLCIRPRPPASAFFCPDSHFVGAWRRGLERAMDSDDLLTDEYVASLLAEDAQGYLLGYSMAEMGDSQSKMPAHLPRTNKRFLQNILKGTDAHNKTLLAKETKKSQAKLEELDHAEQVKKFRTDSRAHNLRSRQMGDIQAILGGKSCIRDDNIGRHARREFRTEDESRSGDGKTTKRAGEPRSSHRDGDEKRKQESRSSARERRGECDEKQRVQDLNRKHRHRSKTDRNEDEQGRRRHRSRRGESSSPRRRRRSRSPREEKVRHFREHSHLSLFSEDPPDTDAQCDKRTGSDDSDREEMIGPMPPPVCRGRGTPREASSLDRRFQESYNPMDDLDNEEEALDDDAEMLRDRLKLRRHMAERMRAVGFTEPQIQRTEARALDSNRNVVWSKAGETREWDKGKVAWTAGQGENTEDAVYPAPLFSEFDSGYD